MFLRIRCLIIKEFLAVWRDKKSRIILIVPPLIQMFIFTFAATQEVKNVPIAILNKDLGTPAGPCSPDRRLAKLHPRDSPAVGRRDRTDDRFRSGSHGGSRRP